MADELGDSQDAKVSSLNERFIDHGSELRRQLEERKSGFHCNFIRYRFFPRIGNHCMIESNVVANTIPRDRHLRVFFSNPRNLLG